MSTNDDFFDPLYVDREFTRRGKTKAFRFREITGDESQAIFQTGTDKPDPEKTKTLDARLVVAAVAMLGDDGAVTPITLEQAKSMPARFRQELVKVILEVNGFEKEKTEAKTGD
jgi:hypothetical protein